MQTIETIHCGTQVQYLRGSARFLPNINWKRNANYCQYRQHQRQLATATEQTNTPEENLDLESSAIIDAVDPTVTFMEPLARLFHHTVTPKKIYENLEYHHLSNFLHQGRQLQLLNIA